MPTASIIIRTLNEAKHLDELLSGIHSQSVATDLAVELVLVDSGSTDETVEIARTHNCRIHSIRRDEFSFGRSLNIGCDASNGDYLVFVSGHCVPADQNWLQELCQPLIDGVADYVYGRQIGGEQSKFSEKRIFAKYFPEESQIPQAGFYCNNANSAVSRLAWSEFRFDENLTGLEDMYLAKQIVSGGGKVAYTARSCVYHLHDESWPQVRRRFEREALALQQIMPQVHVRQRDVVRYVASSIWLDFREARNKGCLRRNALDIVLYRVNQYLGSYLGNRIHQELSNLDKERYFYPDDSRLNRSGTRLQAGSKPATSYDE